MIFDDEETLKMYVEESLEHLADIETNLLIIEENGKDINEELVNNVFRAAHSIKGGAGFMGLSTIKDLSHKIENILGMVRTYELVPTPESINILLLSFDKLRELISDIKNSNEIDISSEIEGLIKITTASLPEDKKESISNLIDIYLPDGRIVMKANEFDLDQADKHGMFIYIVEYDLVSNIHDIGKTPMEVTNMLQKSGTIIESVIDILAIGTLDEGIPKKIPYFILFASIIEPDVVSALFDVSDDLVHNLDYNQLKSRKPPEQKVPGKPMENEPVREEAVENEPVTEEAVENEPVREEAVENEPVREEAVENEPVTEEVDIEINTKTPAKNPPKEKAAPATTSIRVHITLLDTLMTLAGELVLSRNQLIQGVSDNNLKNIDIASQRINMVTSELQEAIMRTRMQPIANVFNKFPRVVRDLAISLNKEINLDINGKEVELDKTIIESINDPLTHLIRNSVDHGIEAPNIRKQAGKDPVGNITLKAYHEAGQVNIEIADDGKGLDGNTIVESAVKKGLTTKKEASTMSEKEKISLIFLPGFSTAEKVTDVSGRGVGMDVVKTNLDKLGGIVELESEKGKGTVVHIKLPLTLAILPSQIISSGTEKYAIPQVNLNELLRVPPDQIKTRIEKVGDADVVRLRGQLLPLLNLKKLLNIESTYIDPSDGKKYSDRRNNIADRRSKTSPLFENEIEFANDSKKEILFERSETERRTNINSAINIAVVSTGACKYGLIVDKLRDSEEIVIKPLGRHLTICNAYAGATIMGDGNIALILDILGLSHIANLTSLEGTDRVAKSLQEESLIKKAKEEYISFLLFKNGDAEQFCVALSLVERIEKIKFTDIEIVGGKKIVQYRGGTLPLFSLDEVAKVQPFPTDKKHIDIIIFSVSGKEVGLMANPPIDAVETNAKVDTHSIKQPGIIGSCIIENTTTLMVDIFEIIKILNPEWEEKNSTYQIEKNKPGILFAEDSDFFRNQVKGFLEDDGYNVFEAQDGSIAWDILEDNHEKIDIIVTDLEMPVMDGFELTKKIKTDSRFSHYTVIALTSLAADKDVAKGKKVGIDDYQIKLDREKLLVSIQAYLSKINV